MRFLLTFLLMAGCLLPLVAKAETGQFEQALELLSSRDFDERGRAIELLVNSGHQSTEKLLNKMLDGDLYYRKDDNRIVTREKEGSKYRLYDAISGEDLGLVSRRKAKKVSINNRLRGQLKLEISALALNHADPRVRLESVEGMIGKADADMLIKLDALKARETDNRVIDAINTVTAFAMLESDDIAQQQLAIDQLKDNLNPVVLGTLRQLVATTDNPTLKKEAQQAIEVKQHSLINLKQALEMNDEAKLDEKKLIDRHKKFFDLERNRFIQIINELD